ncbi:MAG: hypothetical protein HYT76_07345 [Deltaproteobacteria bacterium]|nr:hypothetical protein [Deltaproteobacteria bacterium]
MSQIVLWQKIGLVASVILPFFNIPLIVRMIQRRSSADLSLLWVTGVYLCMVAMEPLALFSTDWIFKLFATMNLIFFSGVVFLAYFFRMKRFQGRGRM